MKRRFIIAFSLLFGIFTIGIGTSIFLHWKSSTSLRRVVTGHQIEELRQELSSRLHRSKNDLQISDTVFATQLDEIIANVLALDRTVEACFSCHHEPDRVTELQALADLVEVYKARFSTFITAFLDAERRQALQLEAAESADQIDVQINSMLLLASEALNERTSRAMDIVDRSWQVLAFTLALTFVLAVLIASKLVRSVTEPISRLVAKTEHLASGDLGVQIEHQERDEIGSLVDSFNQMSTTLASNKERIDGYVGRLHTLNEAVFSLHATPDMEALRDRLSQAMEKLVEAEIYGTILRVDEGSTFISNLRMAGQPQPGRYHGLSDTRLGRIRKLGETESLLIRGGDSPEWPFGTFDMGVDLRNFLVGWITFNDELIGALIVVNKTAGEFVAEDGEIVSALTKGVAEAIQNIRLYQELQARI